jgi:hypothetical protein
VNAMYLFPFYGKFLRPTLSNIGRSSSSRYESAPYAYKRGLTPTYCISTCKSPCRCKVCVFFFLRKHCCEVY